MGRRRPQPRARPVLRLVPRILRGTKRGPKPRRCRWLWLDGTVPGTEGRHTALRADCETTHTRPSFGMRWSMVREEARRVAEPLGLRWTDCELKVARPELPPNVVRLHPVGPRVLDLARDFPGPERLPGGDCGAWNAYTKAEAVEVCECYPRAVLACFPRCRACSGSGETSDGTDLCKKCLGAGWKARGFRWRRG